MYVLYPAGHVPEYVCTYTILPGYRFVFCVCSIDHRVIEDPYFGLVFGLIESNRSKSNDSTKSDSSVSSQDTEYIS